MENVLIEEEEIESGDVHHDQLSEKIPETSRLGGKFYYNIAKKKAKGKKVQPAWPQGKRQYLDLQENVHSDTAGSDLPVGNEEFRQAMNLILPEAILHSKELFDMTILGGEAFNFPAKYESMKDTSKSEYYFYKMVETLTEYMVKMYIRRNVIFDIPKKALEIYLKHCQNMENAIGVIDNMPFEEQHNFLLSRLPANKNAGWPYFYHQTKDNALELFNDICLKLSVRAKNGKGFTAFQWISKQIDDELYTNKGFLYFTVQIIYLFAQFLLLPTASNSEGTFPPYILFYRTQGGKETKVRAVFGSWFGLKIIGMLMSAAKKVETFEYVLIGDWPWMAGLNWDELFGVMAETCEKEVLESEIAGEDASGWDQSQRYDDFSFIVMWQELKSKCPIYYTLIVYCIKHMHYADTWIDKSRIKGPKDKTRKGMTDADENARYIFFNSGNPWTSEGGSLKHLIMAYAASEKFGWQIKHATFLSDDNLIVWSKDFDLTEYINFWDERGFIVDEKKTFLYSRDKGVSFLKNWIGPILPGNDQWLYVGDLNSRFYAMLHSERDVEEYGSELGFGHWIVLDETTPQNRIVNQILGKLGSMGKAALPIIKLIVDHVEFKKTYYGKEVIKAIYLMKVDLVQVRTERDDLPASFSPLILKDLNISAVDLRGQN